MPHNHALFIRLFAFGLLLFCKSLYGQQSYLQVNTVAKFDSIRNNFPREKLYVHFDKSVYAPQDTVWFKAYLVDASMLEASKVSGLIYFEMFDANGNLTQRMALPSEMGLAHGGFALNSDLYKAGSYTFRAYTNWMQNFGNTYLFKKEIKVVDFFTDDIAAQPDSKKPSSSKRANTLSAAKSSDIDIQFLPEGGNWLSDRTQKMAFKAINVFGKGIKVTGEIFDSKQNKIVNFQSNDKGMGHLTMTPLANEVYTANVRYGESLKKQNLQKASTSGSFLQVKNNFNTDSLAIDMFSDLPDQEITMIGQSRGVLCFVAKFNSGIKYNTFHLAKSLFPTGVCQIILTNGKNQIINERNFFIQHQDALNIHAKSELTTYNSRDSINISMNILDVLFKPVSGSFSVAITDDNQVSKDGLNDNNILSQFLLNADIKGEIDSPGYYFNNFNEQKHDDLDALMLTQGWVSYNWESARKPQFKAEKDFTISGRITNAVGKPGINAQVLLLGTKKPFSIAEASTNANGEFIFTDFPPLDSAAFVLQVKNSKGKSGTLGFELNNNQFPSFMLLNAKKQIIDDEPLDSISTQFIVTKNEEFKAAYQNGTVLREVKITGKRIVRGSKNLNGDGNADLTIAEAELDKVPNKTLFNLIEENVKGFRIGGKITTDYFVYNHFFRLVIDGYNIELFYDIYGTTKHIDFIKRYLDHYSAEDIKGIELMSSSKYSNSYFQAFENPMDPRTFAYVEVTTRSGEGPFLRHVANKYKYRPQFSYGDNKVFYSPKYTSENKTDKNPDYRSTLYWNPDVVSNEQGEANFSFFSADKKGSYTVWIEGSDMGGNFGFKTIKLNVK